MAPSISEFSGFWNTGIGEGFLKRCGANHFRVLKSNNLNPREFAGKAAMQGRLYAAKPR